VSDVVVKQFTFAISSPDELLVNTATVTVMYVYITRTSDDV